jgi:hypothetical protein
MLQARALTLMQSFNAHDVAITTWALATKKRQPPQELKEVLCQ